MRGEVDLNIWEAMCCGSQKIVGDLTQYFCECSDDFNQGADLSSSLHNKEN